MCVALLEIPHHMTNMYNDFGFKPSTTISTNQKSWNYRAVLWFVEIVVLVFWQTVANKYDSTLDSFSNPEVFAVIAKLG